MTEAKVAALTAILLVGACGSDGSSGTGPPIGGGDASCEVLDPDPDWTFTRLGAGTKPAIAVDGQGTVHVAAVVEDLDGWVRYLSYRPSTGELSDPETLARGYFYGPIDIAVSGDGRRGVVYHDHNLEDQVLASFDGGDWTLQPMTNQGHDGWYNVAAFDAVGRLHTGSFDPRGFGGVGVNYGVWDGIGWSVEVAAPGSFDYAGGLAIAVGAGNAVHVAYFDDQAGVAHVATRAAPMAWSSTEIEPLGTFTEVGRFPDLRLDPDGETLHLVYLARTGASQGVIRYAAGTPGDLTARDLTSVSDFDIGFDGARDMATLALRPDGTPVVSVQTRDELAVFEVDPGGDRELVRFRARDGIRYRQQTRTQVGPDGRIHVGFWQTGEEEPGTLCHAVGG